MQRAYIYRLNSEFLMKEKSMAERGSFFKILFCIRSLRSQIRAYF